MKNFKISLIFALSCVIFLFPLISFSRLSDSEIQKVVEESSNPCTALNCKAIDEFLENLRRAIKNNNKKEVASFMDYPLKINKKHNKKTIYIFIKNESEFIQQYNSIITSHVKKRIFEAKAQDVIYTYQGIGAADGIIWLLGDNSPGIFVINVD